MSEEKVVETAEAPTAEVESPTPTEEAPTDEVTTEGQVETEVEGAEAEPETPQPAPEMTKEQSEAFQKMRLENKRLQEELASRSKLQTTLNQAVANETSSPAKGAVTPEEMEVMKATLRYPVLDKESSEYDAAIEQRVAEKWLFAKKTGLAMTVEQAAKAVLSESDKTVKKAVKAEGEKTAKEVKESVSLKEQSSAIAPTKSAGERTTKADLDSLRLKTRLGDSNAFQERLKRIGQ